MPSATCATPTATEYAIRGGTLVVDALSNAGVAGNLGAASASAANLLIDGGTLQVLTSSSTDRGLTIGAAGANLKAAANNLSFGGTLTTAGTGDRTLTFELGGASNNTSTLSGTISDTATSKLSLVKNGSGRLSFTGAAKSYSGDTIVNGGTLLAFATNVMSSGAGRGNVVVNADATLDMRFSQSINGLNGAGRVTNNDANNTRTLTLGNADANGDFSGAINARLNLVKTGTGVQILGGPNTFTGSTAIRGTLTATSLAGGGVVSSIGQSPADAANLVLDGGTLRYTGGPTSTDRLFTVGPNGAALEHNGTGSLNFTSLGSIAHSSTGDRTLTLSGSNGNTSTINSALSDPAGGKLSLIKSGTGRWFLSGSNKTYSGDTQILAGTLQLGSVDALPFGLGRGNIAIASGAKLNLFANSTQINGLDGAGTLDVGGTTTRTLTLGHGNANGSFAGDIVGANLIVTKTGAGGQTLSGISTYGKQTNVDGGTLIVNGSINSSPIFVNNATLGGTGSVRSITAGTAASIAPGDHAIGSLAVVENATINGTLQIELNGTAGGSSDRLDVGGLLDIAGATISINYVERADPLNDAAYVLAEYGSLDGQFNVIGLPTGYALNYAWFDGIDSRNIALVPIPEPRSMLSAALLACSLLVRRRRSRECLASGDAS